MKSFWSKNWVHFAVLAFFLILTMTYFSPIYEGYTIKQHDVEQHKGMANEIIQHREIYGEEPMWTNSMFGGMPAIQISMLYKGNIFQSLKAGFNSLMGGPSGIFMLHLLGFYIMAMCMRIKPIIAVFGSVAYSLASYEIVILQAGHNSKAVAMALMAPVVGAFIMSYRRNWKWGVILSAFFMTWQLSANHLQVTYYMAILLFFLGAYELFVAVKNKKIKQFGITSAGIIAGYLLAVLINWGNISMTNDYAKHTIRGQQDLTINPDGTPLDQEDGLDADYITNWSYGKGESFTLISPYVKGSHSAPLSSTTFAEIALDVDMPTAERKAAMDMPLYWGEQPMTSGPVYLGVIAIFIALLGLVLLKDRIKWVIFGVTVLALMLSWGKNFMGLTDFFINYVPGYNKFRTVTIILVLIELCVPLLAVYTLQRMYENREEIKERKKAFLYTSGAFMLFLLIMTFVGLKDGYVSSQDYERLDRYRSNMLNQISNMDPKVLSEQYQLDINNTAQVDQFVEAQMEPVYQGLDGIKKVRKQVYRSSMLRSFGFGLLAVLVLALYFYSSVSLPVIAVGATAILLIDLVMVDRNYLGTAEDSRGNYLQWTERWKSLYPFQPTMADNQILEAEVAAHPELEQVIAEGKKLGEKKAAELEYNGVAKRRVINSYRFQALNRKTNYRVFDYNGGWQSSRASFFHKSLGGYHGAKLRSIQNVFEFHIARSNNKIFDMMNVKYFIQGESVRPNMTAMGNAWLVKEVKKVASPDEEIQSLGKEFELKNVGSGKLIVNDEFVTSKQVYGGEKLQYLQANGDTLEVPLSNGLRQGLVAYFVADVNGTTNLIPEMTLKADTANSYNTFVSIQIMDDFNPGKDAVMLEREAKKLSTDAYTADGKVNMTSYKANKITYEADVKGKQLIVFSEVYYPDGWTAKVDGKEQEILKVNYLLRGLEVDGGKHKIEFIFDLPKLHSSNKMAVAGTIVLIGLIIFGFWKIKDEEEVTVVDPKE